MQPQNRATAPLTSAWQLERYRCLRSFPSYPGQPTHARTVSQLELATSPTAVAGIAKKSLLTVSPYISLASMSPGVFWSDR